MRSRAVSWSFGSSPSAPSAAAPGRFRPCGGRERRVPSRRVRESVRPEAGGRDGGGGGTEVDAGVGARAGLGGRAGADWGGGGDRGEGAFAHVVDADGGADVAGTRDHRFDGERRGARDFLERGVVRG